jgi:hypothetical protein
MNRFSAYVLALCAAMISLPCTAATVFGTPHLMRPQQPGHFSPQATANVVYFGGPVIGTVQIVAVLWGDNVDTATKTGIAAFLTALPASSYADLLSQYGTNATAINGHTATHQTITRGNFGGIFTIKPSITTNNISDTAINHELRLQIARKTLPANNPNMLYMVYFPANILITANNAQSCSGFLAYHTAAFPKPRPDNFYYGVFPACGGFSLVTLASSHEFAEAVTDGIPTPGSHPNYPQAWNNTRGYEIADLCEYQANAATTLTAGSQSFTVQQIWSNKTGACSTGTYRSP